MNKVYENDGCTVILISFLVIHSSCIHFDVMTQVDTENQISQPCLSEKSKLTSPRSDAKSFVF